MLYATLYFNTTNELLLDVNRGVLRYDKDTRRMLPIVSIRRQESLLLNCFAAHMNTLVTKQQLLADVWRGCIVSDNSISKALSLLRKTLVMIDPDGRCLETVRGVGFVFSPRRAGLIAVASEDFLLSSLHWSRNECRPMTIDTCGGDKMGRNVAESSHVHDLSKWAV